MRAPSFQEIILKLHSFWSESGCVILQPYDLEMGAGTFHPATALHPTLAKTTWSVAYVQPVRRPSDSRFAGHPNRTQHYYQFQVLLKPPPSNIQALYLQSLQCIGFGTEHDLRFIEDDWKSPTLGAWGLGWEIQCNGMEISQFTYMQQLAGVECVLGEITYGLERVAMYVQGVNSFSDIVWAHGPDGSLVSYKDIAFAAEEEFSSFNTNFANVGLLRENFERCYFECERFVHMNLPLVAYDFCIKASHMFNLLESRGVLSLPERETYIGRVKSLAKLCSGSFQKKYA